MGAIEEKAYLWKTAWISPRRFNKSTLTRFQTQSYRENIFSTVSLVPKIRIRKISYFVMSVCFGRYSLHRMSWHSRIRWHSASAREPSGESFCFPTVFCRYFTKFSRFCSFSTRNIPVIEQLRMRSVRIYRYHSPLGL